MAQFNQSVKDMIIQNEGVFFVNNEKDKGGPTKFGITFKFLQQVCGDFVTVEDLKNLTQEKAFCIYENYIWDRFGFSRISNQNVANKIFDMSINMGISQAIKITQRACNSFTSSSDLNVDGILGSKTVLSINQTNPVLLLIKLRELCYKFYQNLIDNDESQIEFKNGWMNRAAS